jgi:hypothetical protein
MQDGRERIDVESQGKLDARWIPISRRRRGGKEKADAAGEPSDFELHSSQESEARSKGDEAKSTEGSSFEKGSNRDRTGVDVEGQGFTAT